MNRAASTSITAVTAFNSADAVPGSSTARFREVNLIADPIYGYIEITKALGRESSERTLLDTVWLQRLRRIHQLQSAWWIFPSAEHSRFVHLLGAMHLSSLFARRLYPSLRNAFPETPSAPLVEETLRLAGLLHDVGHGPFGHFFDQEFLHEWNMDHEVIGRHLVTNQLADIITELRGSPTGRFESGESVDPMWVSWLMADADIPGYVPPPWVKALKPVLCGPATVDNLDYVPRDAYMCGISLGPVDVQRLIHYSFIYGDTVVLHSHAAGALEMFLQSRLYMYTQVYLHRTGRRFDLSMHEIFADTIRELMPPGNPLEHLDQYVDLNDWAMLESVQRWRHDAPGSKRRQLADAWEQIANRNLFWELAFETIAHRGIDLSDIQERIESHLPQAVRERARIQVDVATARIAPHNPMTEDGMVAIYDPINDTVERTATAALIARLPQHNQMLRVFTDDVTAIGEISRASRLALNAS